MHIALWIVQALLAFMFLMAGGMKIVTPLAELAANVGPWVLDGPAFLPRFIGVAEVAGAIGLIAPSALRVLPKLTPAAALGLATVMLLAIPTHVAYGEFSSIGVNLFIMALAGFVAWGRLVKAPIEPRGVQAPATA